MAKHLVIVESPAKAKTIGHYLGKDYAVTASIGHVRDLPSKSLAVDLEHDFAPTYKVSPKKSEVVAEIRKAAAQADVVYLATDPDREGEAIAWHVREAAGIDPAKTQRIAFNQVTKAAVQQALQAPRALDTDLIDAQQARRVLDRLVGYQISPLLSKTIKRALSAGRVQSVALRLVVDREREILAFVPVEYWTLDADLERRTVAKEQFRARLFKIAGQDPTLGNQESLERILPILQEATYTVVKVAKGTRQRKAPPPFITSTLQATASSRLGFSPRQTMRLAQQLYEGIDLEGERVGLITYMRTDSTHVAPEAQAEARQHIQATYGADYLPAQPPEYRTKTANAQEAHEAVRPTSALRTPQAMAAHLDHQQARLYELIWQRFVASQMVPARYATLTVDVVAAQDYLFRATGSRLLFAGFLAVYQEEDEEDPQGERLLPDLQEGEVVDLLNLLPEQHFTQPPPRYNESSLIKALEANGVGRPSTYAAIVTVIQDRGYVIKEQRALAPTQLGFVVCDTLVSSFADIMDVSYTAGMEEQLDQVAAGELGYVAMLRRFYAGFEPQLLAAQTTLPAAVERAMQAGLPAEVLSRVCPQCGQPLQVRLSQQGRFLGCSGYPECRYTLDLTDPDKPAEKRDEFAEGEVCELCGGRMKVIRSGKSAFLGCEKYPKCKNTRPILSDAIQELARETACPDCGQKPLQPMSGRYGEYLRCAACQKSWSLAKLGLKGGAKREGSASGGRAPSAPAETVDLACPACGHRPVEKRSGRFGPYYRCPACKKNTSEKKMMDSGA
jgi:DNA topoisomerase-1